ncbi:MAG: hydroxymethylbilane synthase [Solirubrobacteraceae bacterium]
MTGAPPPLRLGTRGSDLALAQARAVAGALAAGGVAAPEIVEITVTGDRGAGVGDKSRWVAEIEAALLAGEIDAAVHSAKDVPGELAPGTAIAAVPAREDPRDALCGPFAAIDELPTGARVGTSSLRRRAQLLAAREDVEIVELRGNVPTRLRKLAGGEADAIVLAAAGLARLGRAADAAGALDPVRFVPAPGQGALLVQARAGDARTLGAAAPLTDPAALACLQAERALCRELGATCHTPVGALAVPAGPDTLELRAFAGLPDGSAWAADRLAGPAREPEELGRRVAARLAAAGGAELLAQAAATAGGQAESSSS